jgi:sugar phosphate isomerase/epimerase
MDVKAQSSDPGGTVPELIARHAPRAGHFHAQDTNLRDPGWARSTSARSSGPGRRGRYDRWVSVEVFDYSLGAEETARQSSECLRRELDAAQAAPSPAVMPNRLNPVSLP